MATVPYAMSTPPFSKILLDDVSPKIMAPTLYLGASSMAPFIGVATSFALFKDPLGWSFWITLTLMLIETTLVTKDTLRTEDIVKKKR